MIDMHSHFLPSIDDGAKNAKDSISMLSDCYQQGVKICVATPHCIIHKKDSIDSFLTKREYSFSLLSDALNVNETFPNILLGAEVYLDNDISQHSNIEKLCIENTNFMLIELYPSKMNPRVSEWIYNLVLRGINPIIAHVERYNFYERLIQELSDFNLIYQLNASSFLSFTGRKSIKKILNYGETCIVSSDMHNMKERKCYMKDAFEKAQNKFPELSQNIFYNNAKNILIHIE